MRDALKCLIVEDEAISALSFEMDLENAGFEVIGIVATGEKALKFLDQQRPDFILMDIRLAGRMNGFELTRSIFETQRIPVMIITGYPDEELIEITKKYGGVRYLIKPLRTEVLLKEIASLVEDNAFE